MCLLHEALGLAFVMDIFTEHQLPQSGTLFLLSPIRGDGQSQLVAEISTIGCSGSFVGHIWRLAWVLEDL